MTLLATLAAVSQRVSQTSSRLAKVRELADCLRALEKDEIPIAIAFLSGETRQGKLGVSYATLHSAGAGAAAQTPSLSLHEIDAAFAELASIKGAGANEKRTQRLAALFARATPEEQDFLTRLIVGELRQAHVVPRAEQRNELGTDAYFGGVVYAQHASVDPGLFHQGMLNRAREAGATIIPHCPAINIRREGAAFLVETPKGTVAAANVVIATNGYTGRMTPWLQRRVIPIGSYIVATEPLPRDVMARLMPKDRIVSDTRKVVYYYRASPDGQRILFGGRISPNETDPRNSGPLLHAELVRLFPELAGTRISHSWCGFIAYTFDELAHVGQHDGLFYAMGYCGSGVGMAGYLGMRIGQQVLGRKQGATAFDGLAFPTRPFYRGKPWFLAPAIRYYRWRDRVSLGREATNLLAETACQSPQCPDGDQTR